MRTYSTKEAAKLIGVHVVTLIRWLSSGKIRPSIAVPLNASRKLWRFTQADVKRFRKFKATQKRGRKPRKRK